MEENFMSFQTQTLAAQAAAAQAASVAAQLTDTRFENIMAALGKAQQTAAPAALPTLPDAANRSSSRSSEEEKTPKAARSDLHSDVGASRARSPRRASS